MSAPKSIALYACFSVAAAQAATIDFSKDVQPIFEKSCYSCHGAKSQMGGLRLDSKIAAMAGGQSGVEIRPGKSAESNLYNRVAGIGVVGQFDPPPTSGVGL